MLGEWGDPLSTFCKDFTSKIHRKDDKMAGNKTAERVRSLIEATVLELGLKLWDVRFVKEGASWYLRVFIDKEGGVSIDDCTDVSHAIDPILDEADPIPQSYYMEVCSPGLGRELSGKEQFTAFLGAEVELSLYRAENGSKTVRGTLKDYLEGPVLSVLGEEKEYLPAAIAKARLLDDENL